MSTPLKFSPLSLVPNNMQPRPCVFSLLREKCPPPLSHYESPHRDLHDTEEELERHVEEALGRRGKAEPQAENGALISTAWLAFFLFCSQSWVFIKHKTCMPSRAFSPPMASLAPTSPHPYPVQVPVTCPGTLPHLSKHSAVPAHNHTLIFF